MDEERDALSHPTGWETVAARWLVSGRVQGVGYRAFVGRAGGSLGLQGVARNLPDGRVEIVARGARHAMDRLESALNRGPRYARVDVVVREDLSLEEPMPEGFELEF